MTTQAMQEPTFLILMALAAGPPHGMASMTEVTGISEGPVRPRAGDVVRGAGPAAR